MKLGSLIEAMREQLLSVRYHGTSAAIASLNRSFARALFETEIKGISLHSQRTKPGYLFFCLSGTLSKGSDFIDEARNNGATAVVVDAPLAHTVSSAITVISAKDSNACLALALNSFYGFPVDKLNLTAVTGTNGKTTVTFLLENILAAHHTPSGVIGTINYRFGKKLFQAPNTTPDIVTTFDFLGQMVREKINLLFMEVSSHALAQHRIRGLRFNQALFTNLSQDHLDYHATMHHYAEAKSLLFTQYLKAGATAIINSDDEYGAQLIRIIKKDKKIKLTTYGVRKNAAVRATNMLFRANGSSATIHTPRHRFRLRTNLLGVFNMYNILASVGTCLALDIPLRAITSGLENVTVPGRLERVPCARGLRIFIDYAHTEDALRNVLGTLRSLKGKARVITVFGCGGDRDTTKRAAMGRVASELSDQVVITSDNPRSEDPQAIIADIQRGIRKKNYAGVIDRREAIKKAIEIAKKSDIIVVAGKGHEGYQIIKDKKIAFHDRGVIEQILSEKGWD